MKIANQVLDLLTMVVKNVPMVVIAILRVNASVAFLISLFMTVVNVFVQLKCTTTQLLMTVKVAVKDNIIMEKAVRHVQLLIALNVCKTSA